MMITRYGDRSGFLQKFNPDLQIKICRDKELCFFGDAPVLSEINMAYGEMTAAMWLVPQLYNLSEYCGVKDKLEGKSLEECASIIASEFYYLKVSELMLFFYQFKSGKYGKMYGSVDPITIMTSLRTFLSERNHQLDLYEKMLQEQAYNESLKNAITYEEYIARHGKSENLDSDHLDNMASKVAKPEEEKRIESPVSEESLLQAAYDIVNDVYDSSAKTLENMRKTFREHTGLTPEEFITKHKK